VQGKEFKEFEELQKFNGRRPEPGGQGPRVTTEENQLPLSNQ
jgi:hypothetical protein